MGFFDELPPPRPADEPEEYRPPEWLAPPENVVGRFADVGAALVRGPDIAIAADGFVAYPTGVELHMTVLSRRLDYQMDPFFGGCAPDPATATSRRTCCGSASSSPTVPRRPTEASALSLDRRRCSRWTCTQPRGRRRRRPKLARVALALAAPAGGAAALVVEWPSREVPETRVQLSADPLRAAAAHATVLWPDDRPEPPPGGPACFAR